MTWILNSSEARYQFPKSRLQLVFGPPMHCELCSTEGNSDPDPRMAFSIRPWEPSIPVQSEFLACQDTYVRQRDLVASYPQQEPWTFGYQVDFRVHESLGEGCQGLEIWLSIQTSLLESMPQIWLQPESPAYQWHPDGLLIAEHHRAAVVVNPLDRTDCQFIAARPDANEGRLEFFGGFMEKGVIRRARLMLVWSDQAIAGSTWSLLQRAFSESPLPLTA